MRSRLCEGCGAALTIPVDPAAPTFACGFCQREYRTADFESDGERTARHLESGLGRKLEDTARAQRRLIVGVGVGLATLIAGAALFGSSRPREPTPPAPTPPNVTVPAAPRAAEPPAPSPAPPHEVAPPSLATLELTFGGEGNGPGKFDRAHNLAVDRDGNVYVVDRTNRVQKFDAATNLVSTFTVSTKNEPQGELSSDIGYAIGIAVNSKHEILVSIGYDILVLDPVTGSVRRRMLGAPTSICYRELTVDQTDNVYAVSGCEDSHRHALVKLAPDGRVLRRYKEPPSYELSTDEKLAVDGAGKVYAPHGSEREIQVLTPTWEIFTRIGRLGDAPGEFRFPVGPLVLDSKGRLYARESDQVHVFDPSGKVIGRFDTRDAGNAFDLAVGPKDELYALTGKQLVARYAVRLD